MGARATTATTADGSEAVRPLESLAAPELQSTADAADDIHVGDYRVGIGTTITARDRTR